MGVDLETELDRALLEGSDVILLGPKPFVSFGSCK